MMTDWKAKKEELEKFWQGDQWTEEQLAAHQNRTHSNNSDKELGE